MSKRKKISLISIAVLVAVITAVSIISYSLAGLQNKDISDNAKGNVSPALVKRGGTNLDNMEYVSNIDLIIENSDKGETFNIVEIVPEDETADPTDLSTYISNGNFKKYVIDANGTKVESGNKVTMKEDMIDYHLVKVKGDTDLASDDAGEINTWLNAADLIYVSSAKYSSYDGKMSESVYNFLHTYALGEGASGGKPIIVDYVTKTEGEKEQAAKTYKDLVNAISRNYIKYHTFYWKTSLSLDDFFDANGDSYFLPFNVNSNTATGKVLVITNGANTIASKWDEYGASKIINNAYYGRNTKRPKAINFSSVSAEQLEADSSILNVSGFDYDFVIIENDVMTGNISDNVYNAIRSLSIANKFIIYDKANLNSASTGGENQVTDNNNYRKLLDLLLYNTGAVKVSNVLPVSHDFFATLNNAGEAGAESAKEIAKLIDGSNYRGNSTNGGGGSKGKLFRVLEIQPCYPIDLDLAKSKKNMSNTASQYGVKGNYYTDTYNVLSGVSKDEVPEGKEYYNFTLSKAKIAYATGLKPEQIQLDQMSSEEFISSKNVVLETYDLLYIGGDHSALMPTDNKQYSRIWDPINSVKIHEFTTSFEMYTHTGSLVQLTTYSTNSGVYQTTTDHAFGKMKGSSGEYEQTSVSLNGNDLTQYKKEEILDYIKAGMPVIFGSDVSTAYEKVKDLSRMKQLAARDIDPDSQMFQLLSTVYSQYRNKSAAVVWNADLAEQKVNNFYYVDTNGNPTEDETDSIVEKAYGNSLSNQVTVFSKETNTAIKNAVNASNARPSLIVEQQPKDYVYGNPASYNDNNGVLTVKVGVKAISSVTAYTLELYVDYDGNGRFDDSELQDSQPYNTSTESATKTLTYTLPDGFIGLVSWKVLVKENSGRTEVASCTSTTGYAYYKKADTTKKEINVLQIMPVLPKNRTRNDSNLGKDGTTGASLYLCTECQHCLHRAYYNIQIDGDWNSANTYNNVFGISQTAKNDSSFNLGLHEHKFGIVKYDSGKPAYEDRSSMGAEDWDYNFADEDIIKDNYEINLTILYVDEFEKYVEEIASHTNADGSSSVYPEAKVNVNGVDTEVTYKEWYEIKANQDLEEWQKCQEKLSSSGAEEKLVNWLKNYVNDNPNDDFTMDDIENKEYYEFFMKHAVYYNGSSKDTEIRKLYEAYRVLKDAEIEAHEQYKKDKIYAGTSGTWLNNNYDMVVLGFAEDFGGADLSTQACSDLKTYLANDGNMLTTHDSTTRYYDAGSVNLTNELRASFGMDRFHMTLDDEISKVNTVSTDGLKDDVYNEVKDMTPLSGEGADLKYLKYAVLPNYDSTKYFMTEWSIMGSDSRQLRELWQARLKKVINSGYDQLGLRSAVGVTDSVSVFETDSRNSSPYTYGEYVMQDAIHWNQGVNITKGKGTDRASQVNDGIVTTYPFAISSELIISGTHAQTYALDMEDPGVSVWYTLGPDSTGTKKNSSLFAASPHDGMDSYFMFSKGNVFYCGAGHSIVTGPKRDNNDERRLYINVIINSARNKGAGSNATIKLYNPCDENGHTNCDDNEAKKVGEDEIAEPDKLYVGSNGMYEYNVTTKDAVPQFDFKVNSADEITKVQVYYDLNYGEDGANAYEANADHVLIAEYTNYTSGTRVRLRKDDKNFKNLPLKPEYFNGNSTYIVIAAKTAGGNTVYKRIQIKYIPDLFDLTDAETQKVNYTGMDRTNRTRFVV